MEIEGLFGAGPADGGVWDGRFLAPGLLIYALVAGLCWLGIRKLLPPPRRRLVSWTAVEVVVVFFLLFVFWPNAASLLVTETGLGESVYGAEVVEQLRRKDAEPNGLAGSRVALLVTALALPFQLATVPWVLLSLSRTRPYQYGLTAHRLGRNALLGVLLWAVLTPPVLAVNFGVGKLVEAYSREGVSKHAFERLSASGQMASIDIVLIVFVAVASAPLIEELLFRGVIQGWLTRCLRGSHVTVLFSLIIALPWSAKDWRLLHEQPDVAVLIQVLSPTAFVLLLVPAYVGVCMRSRTPEAPAVFAASLLFAMVHRSVWPSPVPLFVLALGLDWLARRTQSLVGPVVLHALFNGVACVQMFLIRT
jgi:membrane protease YdiL (CAAX protease family)